MKELTDEIISKAARNIAKLILDPDNSNNSNPAHIKPFNWYDFFMDEGWHSQARLTLERLDKRAKEGNDSKCSCYVNEDSIRWKEE